MSSFRVAASEFNVDSGPRRVFELSAEHSCVFLGHLVGESVFSLITVDRVVITEGEEILNWSDRHNG